MKARDALRIAGAFALTSLVVACAAGGADSGSNLQSAQVACSPDDPICDTSDAGATQGYADGGAVACAAAGNSCNTDDDCCAGGCSNGTCGGVTASADGGSDGPAPYCSPGGVACTSPTDCCSGICNGTCATAPGDAGGGDGGGIVPPPPPPPPPPDAGPACQTGGFCNDDGQCCSHNCFFWTCQS